MVNRLIYEVTGSDAKSLYDGLADLPDTVELVNVDFEYGRDRGAQTVILQFADLG